ncbi:S8 family serine peptidase [Marinobacter caseinilyticus]|uniref:S8 family serine peptidase n=1 Tax=Marinobacter caseinilyticus TaxID=2692195 RepID=UPI001408A941|nr:S8 family serine peptidase [Marinobacter caseinilyticus]
MQNIVRSWGVAALFSGALVGCGGGGGSGAADVADDLSGTITIESRTRVDSDTADDARLGLAIGNSPNDERPGSASQGLPGTGIFGGYVSAISGTYPASGYPFVADSEDLVSTRLSPGDRVALQVFDADPSFASPNIRFSINTGSAELCDSTCQNDPSYLYVHESSSPVDVTIAIGAESGGPARYVLTVTAEGSTASTNLAYGQADFLVDEAVVIAGTSLAGPSASATGMASALSASNARALGNGSWHLRRTPPLLARRYSVAERNAAMQQTLAWIRTLQERADVVSAGPNYLYEAQAIDPSNDPLYSLQWHYPLINLPLAWQLAPNGGQGVGVAVLDTGLFSASPGTYGNWHPDLDANVVALDSGRTLDFVTGALDIDSEDVGARDGNPADPGDGQQQSSSFHGTHVAGIVSGVDNTTGIVGVAPQSTLYPVRVLGKGGVGSSSDLIAGLNWAASDPGIHAINLSLGGLGPDPVLKNAIDTAFGNGKLVVAAAGNQGSSNLTYPAAFENVIGVGAVDAGRRRASYSNFGGSVDVVAPGGDASRDANNDGNADVVISAWGEDADNTFVPRYTGLQGTSMAAPHVAGVYALMKDAAQSTGEPMTPGRFQSLLRAGELTDNVGNVTEYGNGLINAVKSVNAALNGASVTLLSSEPSALQFSDSAFSQSFVLEVFPADGSVLISGVTSPSWLSVAPEPSGAPTAQTITATLDTTGLAADAELRDVISVAYQADGADKILDIPVRLQLGNESGNRDAGRHYVLLLNSEDPDAQAMQQVVEATDGRYRFAFPEVAAGRYFLVAGSDTDNNGFICETGEACAEYPVNGLPELISLGEQSVTGVTISTSFRRPTITAMGLPRIGFEGYPVNTKFSDTNDGDRQKEVSK